MSGWIKLHRKTLNSPIFDNPHLLKMWMWCLLKASHKGYTQIVGVEEIELTEGQFITGRNKGSSELNVNPSTWYKHLKMLEKLHMIELKSNNKMTVVTVVNWALYQGIETEKEQPNNNKITTKEQPNNTNKNVKNEKNVKNKDIMDYKSIYDYYLTLDLVKHRKYTNDISKAIKKAMTDNKYDIEYCKLLLDRHKKVVEITKNNEKPVTVRGLTQFFGQKAYNATHLICSEYEEGGKLYETHLRNKKEVQERGPLKMVIRDDY